MVSKSAKQNCSTCLHGHEPHVNRMSKKSNPMLSVIAGNKSSFIGGARKRARNLALFFLSFTFLVASVIGIAVHAEFAFGPCGRLLHWKLEISYVRLRQGLPFRRMQIYTPQGHVYLAAPLKKQGSWSGWTNRAWICIFPSRWRVPRCSG